MKIAMHLALIALSLLALAACQLPAVLVAANIGNIIVNQWCIGTTIARAA